eukprot:537512-Rhodomonas_salina.2
MPGSGNAGVGQWNGGAGVPGGVCFSARGPGASARSRGRGRPSISNKPFNSIISLEGAFLGYFGAQNFGYEQDESAYTAFQDQQYHHAQ